jgi:ABC-type Zn uptake system ZnuABC Zn-binding protein ZnuA
MNLHYYFKPAKVLFFALIFLSNSQAQDKLKVVATASMIADMAKQIAGDKVSIECIVPIGGDPHLHSPTPRDVKMVAAADLILKNGLTFEGWLSELIDNSGTKGTSVLVTEGVNAIESPTYKNSSDPHAWMDITNGYIYIKNIRNALIKLDPNNKAFYENKHDLYLKNLEETHAYIHQLVQTIPKERRILITSHDAFQYYGRQYGIQLEAVMGISTDVDVQTSDMIRLNKVIKSSGVPAIFMESTINPKLLKQLAADNGIAIGGELYADSIGDEDSPAPSYIDMLRHNTEVIAKALTQEKKKQGTHEEGSKDSSRTNWWLYGIIAVLGIGGFLLVIKKIDQ